MYIFILNKAHWGDGVTVRRTASHTTSAHSRVLSAGRQCPPITVRVRPFPRVGQLTTQGLSVTQTFTNGPCLWRPALGRGQWQAPNARTPSGDGGGPNGVPGRTEQGCLLPCPSCLGSRLAPSGPFPRAAPPSLSGRPSGYLAWGLSLPSASAAVSFAGSCLPCPSRVMAGGSALPISTWQDRVPGISD